MGSQEQSNVDVSELQLMMPNNVIWVTRRLNTQGSEIVWLGAASTCDKQLKHYRAFRRNETTIAVHSFVLVMAEGGGRYVGYLEDLYADKRGKKKASVRWFLHNREVKELLPDMNFDPREILITPHVQAFSIDCIEGFAEVLTPTHYEKSLAVISLAESTQVYMCCRQMISNKVKPFLICSLRGYSCQPILASIDRTHSIGAQINSSEIKISNLSQQIMEREQPAKKSKIKFTNGGERSMDLVEPRPPSRAPFKSGQRIEVLSQDSGMRGCWFRCKILMASRKCLKIQYVDIVDIEDSTNLEECISACRVADPDKLGMRCIGRPTVRPYPPKDSVEKTYEIGTAVDAWWCDAWWEGIIIGLGQSRTDSLLFYSPGENLPLAVENKDLRISRDWIGDKWVDIMAKKDILTCIPPSLEPKTVSQKLDVVLEVVDENEPELDLLKPLQIGDGDKKEDKGGDSGAGKSDYLGPN